MKPKSPSRASFLDRTMKIFFAAWLILSAAAAAAADELPYGSVLHRAI
jgi:hypothetical protein